MGAVHLVVLLVVFTTVLVDAEDPKATSEQKKVVCYFTNWSYKREAPYDFTPDKIDPFVCTHIIYAFADLGSRNNLISSDPKFDFDKHAFRNITTNLKKQNKDLKVLLSIGGWVTGTLKFAHITANETNRREFSKNAVRFIRGYQFDGLDLNWQHPTFREGGTPEDRENYVLLAKALKEEFVKEAKLKNKPRLLLSIAISHNEKFLPGYDLESFNKYMDFISVICYDYHFSYENAANHHSPLYSLSEDADNEDANVNTNYTIHLFSKYVDPSKLVMGIPTYGRTYKLVNSSDTALGSPADGPGEKGPYTGSKGFLAHFEICNAIKNENWTVVQTKPGLAGPYAFKGDQWVCYDDIEMTRTKAAYAKEKGLAGVMFWTIDYDDFTGNCYETKFHIIRAARNELLPPPDNKKDDTVKPADLAR